MRHAYKNLQVPPPEYSYANKKREEGVTFCISLKLSSVKLSTVSTV